MIGFNTPLQGAIVSDYHSLARKYLTVFVSKIRLWWQERQIVNGVEPGINFYYPSDIGNLVADSQSKRMSGSEDNVSGFYGNIITGSRQGFDEPWPHLLFVYFKTISGSVSAAFRSVGGDKANSGLLAVNVGLLPYEIQDDGVYSNADDSGNEIPHKQRGILWWSFWRRHIDHINPVGRFCLVIISIGAFFFSVIRAGRSRRGWQFALLFLLSCISIFPAVAIGYYWLFRLSGW